MAEVELDITQWGNNLGVRLPATIARRGDQHDALAPRLLTNAAARLVAIQFLSAPSRLSSTTKIRSHDVADVSAAPPDVRAVDPSMTTGSRTMNSLPLSSPALRA